MLLTHVHADVRAALELVWRTYAIDYVCESGRGWFISRQNGGAYWRAP